LDALIRHCPFTGAAIAAKEKVGEFQASGFLFKDTVEVTALDDPDGEDSCNVAASKASRSLK
jgi:catabolite regulation protein CreA